MNVSLCHLKKNDLVALYKTQPICQVPIIDESTQYKIAEFQGRKMFLSVATGQQRGHKDMIAIPLSYPRQRLSEVQQKASAVTTKGLESLTSQELYILESILDKIKA